jgi:tetratricopeptide (TPR) repeat protein
MVRALTTRVEPSGGARRAVLVLGLSLALSWGPPPLEVRAAADVSLDQILAAYTSGDHAIVERAFAKSNDFQRYKLIDQPRLERWLGTWSRPKAAMLIEIIDRASQIAPAYSARLLGTGQRYVLSRKEPPGASAADDVLERRWHLIAIAGLQRRFLGAEVVRYVDNLQAGRPFPANALVWDSRVHLGRAVGQEQRCRLMHATARHDRVLAELEGASSTPAAERSVAIECVQVALSFFEAAASHAAVREEARTRAAFAQFQLGRNADARQSLESVNPGDDRTLAYWRSLFRGRVADALGSPADAEQAYRDALAGFPDAHSASIGLALSLFRLQRDDEAEAAVKAVRQRSLNAVDPWETYYTADARFVERWIAELREGRQ